MSSRHLRAVLEEKEDQCDAYEFSEARATRKKAEKKRRKERRRQLQALSNVESDVMSDEELDTPLAPLPLQVQTAEGQGSSTAPPRKSHQKKKKKKKASAPAPAEDAEDLDRAIEMLVNARGSAPAPSPSAQPAVTTLACTGAHLNWHREMARRLGRAGHGLGAHAEADERGPGGRPRRAKHRASLFLGQPPARWPSCTPGQYGLSMRAHAAPELTGRARCFTFVAGPAWRRVQASFEAFVETHDPTYLQGLVAEHPFHVPALLQLHTVASMQGQHEAAVDHLHRALYCLERALSPACSLLRGDACVPYAAAPEDIPDACPEMNRALHVALFRHMIWLSKIGCPRAALEVSKVLLALDPTDPLCVRLCVDAYALRAHEERFLLEYVAQHSDLPAAGDVESEDEEDEALSLLERTALLFPNIALALPLCAWRLESAGNAPGEGLPSSGALLEQAVALFPQAFAALLDKLASSIPAELTACLHEVRQSRVLRQRTASASLEHLIRIMVARNAALWDGPETLRWLLPALERAVAGVAEHAEVANHLAVLRERVFPASSFNDFQHVSFEEYAEHGLPALGLLE